MAFTLDFDMKINPPIYTYILIRRQREVIIGKVNNNNYSSHGIILYYVLQTDPLLLHELLDSSLTTDRLSP